MNRNQAEILEMTKIEHFGSRHDQLDGRIPEFEDKVDVDHLLNDN